jgi:hypothetical protein
MAEAFPLYAEIKIPVPGPKAFRSIDGDNVGFVKRDLFRACFKIRVFFLKYNVETTVV